MLGNRWLPLAFTTGTAVALWALAAAHGYGWQMIWLPAAVAGVAWPRDGKRTLDHCLRATPPTAGREQMTLRVLVTAAVAHGLSAACRRRCVCG